MRAATLVGLACFAAPAAVRAQPRFFDDFESFRLMKSTPPGKWDTAGSSPPDSGFTIEPPAAHRGDAGLRCTDGDGSGTVNIPCEVRSYLATGIDTGDAYARYWLRASSVAYDAGSRVRVGSLIARLVDGGTMGIGDTLIDVWVDYPAGRIYVGGFDGTPQYATDPFDAGFSNGVWHLIEEAAIGLGTDAGGRALWLDRQLVGMTPRTVNNVRVQGFSIGENFSAVGTAVGLFDFDDARLSTAPPASGVLLSASASSATQNTCVPISVSLVDSSDRSASAPYDVQVDLQVAGGGGTFYADPLCGQPVVALTVDAGVSARAGWFAPASSGALTLSAGAPDFLPLAGAALEVFPCPSDAGCFSGPPAYAVGCGCASSGSATGWLAMLALVLFARRSFGQGR